MQALKNTFNKLGGPTPASVAGIGHGFLSSLFLSAVGMAGAMAFGYEVPLETATLATAAVYGGLAVKAGINMATGSYVKPVNPLASAAFKFGRGAGAALAFGLAVTTSLPNDNTIYLTPEELYEDQPSAVPGSEDCTPATCPGRGFNI